MTLRVSAHSSANTQRHISKFINDESNPDDLENTSFSQSHGMRKQKSHLWQILFGKEEWEALIEIAKAEGKANLWLDAKTDRLFGPDLDGQPFGVLQPEPQ